jgi:hypothetical protein
VQNKRTERREIMFTLKQLQQEHAPWVLRNFHPQTPDNSWAPFVGMIEEIGELEAAQNQHLKIDAIGDIMIYMSDYCSCLGLDLEALVFKYTYFFSWREMILLLGSLSHSQLKLMQKIRGSEEAHKNSIIQGLAAIIAHLRIIIEYDISDMTLEEICEHTWNVVKKRDWKANPLTGNP